MSATDRDELLADVDLPALWVELVGPRGRSGWPCPVPTHAQSGATPPVSIRRDPKGIGRWKCFGCDAGGSPVDLLVALGATVPEAMHRIRALTGRPLPDRRSAGDAVMARFAAAIAPAPPPAPAAVVGARPGRPEVLDVFVATRGWDREVVERFGLSVVLDGRGRPRVRLPYRDGGEVPWHQDRATEPGQEPKYLSPPGPGAIPFALDLGAVLDEVARCSTAIVVEGPPDAVALAHVGTWGEITLALPGVSAIAPEDVADALADTCPGLLVVVAVDADPAGDRLREKLADALEAQGCRVATVRPPDGFDLDDWHRHLGTERFADAFAAAIVDHHAAGVEEVAA